HFAVNQLGRITNLDRDNAVGHKIGRGENSRKATLSQSSVDSITPVNCQVDQLVEVWLVGLSAVRTEDGECRKFTGTARAAIHSLLLLVKGLMDGENSEKGWAEYR